MTRDGIRAVALAAIMVVSVVAMGVGGITGTAVAQEETNETVTTVGHTAFNQPSVSEWTTDRASPSNGYESLDEFENKSDVLRIGIDDTVTKQQKNGVFYRTEGIKTQSDFGQKISADLYIDSDWQTTPVRAGIWPEGYNADGELSAYPLIEFTTAPDRVKNQSDPEKYTVGGNATFRIYDFVEGEWIELEDVDVEYGDWVSLTVELNEAAGQWEYYIDGEQVATFDDEESTHINGAILNSYNYGFEEVANDSNLSISAYDVHWASDADVSSIDEAVSNANDGETVEITSGTYNETVLVDVPNVTIKSADGASPTVEGAFDIAEDGATVDGLEIESTDGPAVSVSSGTSGFTFSNNHVLNDEGESSRHGLLFEGGQADHLITNNTFENQQSAGNNPILVYVNGETSVGLKSTNVDLINNTFTGSTLGNGVALGHEATNSEITGNTFDVQTSYSQLEVWGNNVSILDNEFNISELNGGASYVSDSGENINESTLSENHFKSASYVDATGAADGEVFSTIGDSLDAASPNATVTVSGEFNESITVGMTNVSVRGDGGDALVDGQITLSADGSSVSDLRVTTDDAVDTSSNVPVILVQSSNTSVERLQIDGISGDGDNTLDIIQVFNTDSETVSNVKIHDNTIEDINSPGVVGTSAIKLQGNLERIDVLGNKVDGIHSEGWAYGVVTTPSGNSPDQEVSDVSVRGNTIQNVTAEKYAGVGVGVDTSSGDFGTDGGNATEVSVSANTVRNNDLSLINKDVENYLDATLNYFGNTTPTVQGDVTYDPFLTVEPDEVDAESLEETTQFGHDLVVPADGTPHSVAFPAPVEGNVSEVFGEFNGTVFAYDGDGWESGSEITDEDVGALDAFVVKVDEDESDLRIAFEYAASDAQYPTSTDLEEGWNFVGAPESGNSTDAFDVTTTNIQTVSHINAGAGSQPYGASSTAPFATNPDSVSPFQGYWVFVTDDGELGATVPVGPTQSNEEGALAGN